MPCPSLQSSYKSLDWNCAHSPLPDRFICERHSLTRVRTDYRAGPFVKPGPARAITADPARSESSRLKVNLHPSGSAGQFTLWEVARMHSDDESLALFICLTRLFISNGCLTPSPCFGAKGARQRPWCKSVTVRRAAECIVAARLEWGA